jgi:hypothetical protein
MFYGLFLQSAGTGRMVEEGKRRKEKKRKEKSGMCVVTVDCGRGMTVDWGMEKADRGLVKTLLLAETWLVCAEKSYRKEVLLLNERHGLEMTSRVEKNCVKITKV